MQRVLAFLAMNFGHSELSTDVIAREHHVSKRHLFKVWSAQPDSIGLCAHSGGFVDSSHFSRRFRQTYGLSPRQYRPGGPECD